MPDKPVITGLTQFEVGELHAYHKNPRRGNIDAIARSLEINGQYRPIVVNIGSHTGRPLEVLAGNHTLAAAKRLGWVSIQATTVDVDDLAAARIVAADNRTADLGDYDNASLADLLQAIADDAGTLAGTGYADDYLDKLLADDAVEDAPVDDIPEVWGVVIECPDEQTQVALLEEMLERGLSVRALM